MPTRKRQDSCYTPAVPRKPPKPAPVIVKRPTQERKRLAPELEAFARSDETRLRVRRPTVDRGKVDDPREGYAIAGVANRDARSVYDARATELVSLWDGGEADENARHLVEERLLDVRRLTLWRARRVTGFAAFAEQVLGIQLKDAEAMSEAAAQRLGEPLTPLTEREVALWLRTEAGLYEGDPSARAFLRTVGGQTLLTLSIQSTLASMGLTGAGARHAPLARAQREQEGRPLEQPEREAPPVPAGARLLRRRAPVEESAPEPEIEASEVESERPAREERPRERGVERERAERPRVERPRPERAAERPRVDRAERPRVERPTFERGGERPRFQENRGRARPEADRPRFQERSERPAMNGAERPRFQERGERARPEGDRPRFQDRTERARPEGDRPQGRFAKAGERPAFQKRGAAGKAGDRPAFQKRGAPGGDRPAFQKRGAAGKGGDRPAFGKKPFFKAGGPGASKGGFDKGKSFAKGKGFGERKRFGDAKDASSGFRGDKKPFKKKPGGDDEG